MIELLAERVGPTGQVVGPELLRQAGLERVEVEARADVYASGSSRRTIHPDLVHSMRAKIVGSGLADEAELEQLDGLRAHLADPHTLTLPRLYFLAWGGQRTEEYGP
jgi:hypothetical protein